MDRTVDVVRVASRGAVAGVVATAVMSATMRTARALGMLGRMPPRKITDHVLQLVGLKKRTPRGVRAALATVNHFAFGASCGALFALGHAVRTRRASRARSPALGTTAAGIAFGSVVWLVSYAGWVPALGVMPSPRRDRRGRPTSMLIAHVVYGAVLGGSVSRLERARSGRSVQVADESCRPRPAAAVS